MNKNLSLEGLRGVAALVVVIFHYIVAFYPSLHTADIITIRTHQGIELLISKLPINVLYNGNFAVCIFFVLSGYVLTYKYYRYDDKDSLKAGACKRYFRLMPPVLFSVFMAYLFMTFGWFYNLQAAELTLSDWWLARYNCFEPNFLGMIKQGLYGAFFARESTYNNVLWTMYYEIYGSIMVLACSSIVGKMKNRWIIYILVIMGTINTYYLAFVLGMLLCDMLNTTSKASDNFKDRYVNYLILVVGLFLGSFPTVLDTTDTFYSLMKINGIDNPAIFWHILGAMMVMFGILNLSILSKLLANKIFVFLGKISFSMYLMHIVILYSFSCVLFLALSKHMRYYQCFTITLLLSLPVILLVAYLVNRYVDAPAVKLSRCIYIKYLI